MLIILWINSSSKYRRTQRSRATRTLRWPM